MPNEAALVLASELQEKLLAWAANAEFEDTESLHYAKLNELTVVGR